MKLLCVSHPSVLAANQNLFAEVMKQTGWDVKMILPSAWKSEFGKVAHQQLTALEGRTIPVRVLGKGNIPLHVYVGSLSRIIEAEQPDVLYIHHEAYGLAAYQALRASRRVDPVIGFYSAQNLSKRYPWPFSRLEHAVLERARFAFPVSERALAVLRSKGYKGSAEVLPLPVDVSAFKDADPLRKPGLSVGFVGRLVPIKGVDILLDALAALPQEVTAIIVGDGPKRDEYKRYAAQLGLNGRVRWEGYVPHNDVSRVYSEFDVLAVPSRAPLEQFGRVVVEALAAGVPVVASDAGELPRVVVETGGGWIFPQNDSDALRQLIIGIHTHRDEARARAQHGQAVVGDSFSTVSVADRFAGLVARAFKEARA